MAKRVADRGRDDDLIRPGCCHDPGRGDDGRAADLLSAHLAFTGMQAEPAVEAKLTQAIAQPFRGAQRVGCSIEDSEESVTGRIHLARSEERRVGKECRSRWSPYN